MRRGEKKQSVGKSFGKLLIWMVIGGAIGAAVGIGGTILNLTTVRGGLEHLYGSFMEYVLYVQILVSAVPGLICLFCYRRAAGLARGEREEQFDEAEEYQGRLLQADAVGIGLTLLMFGLAADERNPHRLLSVGIFGLGLLLFVVMEVLVVYQAKKMDPMKQGDPADMRFTKDWIDSCDEAEKMITYRACYETFNVMKIALLAAHVAALIGKVSFGMGNFPIVLTCVLWLLQSLVYYSKSRKIERSGVNV